MKHRAALSTLLWAVSLDATCGLLFATAEHVSVPLGFYWALTTATTVGYGDISPHTTGGHILAAIVMLTVVPLFAATFSLMTTSLTSAHVSAETERVRKRLDHVIRHHPDIPALTDDSQDGTL